MALEKALTIRDYLEPRFAAAAGSRIARSARKGLASFQQLLKNEGATAGEPDAAGMKISDYLKNPVLRTQATRPPRMNTVAGSSAIGPRSTETQAEAKAPPAARTAEVDRGATGLRRRGGSRLARSTLQEFRTENGFGHPVEKSVQQSAAKYRLAPELIRGVIRAESNFQVDAVSSAGAKGLMQLMPETAKELGVTNPFDIQQNIDGGARYLRQMLDRFGGDLKQALAAYNAGPGAVEQFNGQVPFPETRQYVQRILRYAGLKA
jgi:soluble lytic murein transglycosylase-like protein